MPDIRGRRTGYENGKQKAVPWVVTLIGEHYQDVVAIDQETAARRAHKEMQTKYPLSKFTVTEIERIE